LPVLTVKVTNLSDNIVSKTGVQVKGRGRFFAGASNQGGSKFTRMGLRNDHQFDTFSAPADVLTLHVQFPFSAVESSSHVHGGQLFSFTPITKVSVNLRLGFITFISNITKRLAVRS
ncbi:MAG: hypothetical protein LUE21_10790, partial [Oscillospiraceae bacterium]|nr:hypothetical protein [Oscillospiraceae bacterium]